jgi:hypothetical protein
LILASIFGGRVQKAKETKSIVKISNLYFANFVDFYLKVKRMHGRREGKHLGFILFFLPFFPVLFFK